MDGKNRSNSQLATGSARRLPAVVLFLVVVFGLFFFSSVSVFAQSATPTATRDFRTPPSTPTPFTVGTAEGWNYTCRSGGQLPVGWGTVTPDGAWEVLCSECLPTATAYPTFDFGGGSRTLQCDGGNLNCQQVDDNTIVFSGTSMSDFASFGMIKVLQDSDLYVYYRYGSYRAYRPVSEEEYTGSLYRGLEIDADVTDYATAVPVGTASPVDGSDTYSGVAANSWVSLIHRIQATYVQDFGCTKIYVSTVQQNPDSVFCAPPATATPDNSWMPTTRPDAWIDLHHIDTSNTTGNASSAMSCNSYLSGIVCDFDLMAVSDQYSGGAGLVLWFNVHNANAVWVFVHARSDGTSYYTPARIVGQQLNTSLMTWGTGSNGNWQGTGVWEDKYQEAIAFSGSPVSFDFGFGNVGNMQMEFQGTIYIMPQPYVEIMTPTPGPTSTQTVGGVGWDAASGNYCQSVAPMGSNEPNFSIVQSSPSICMVVPAFAPFESVPDWFQTLLELTGAVNADWWQSLSGFIVPASTLCYHEISFVQQYFLNVAIPLSSLAFVTLGIWFLGKITSKGK